MAVGFDLAKRQFQKQLEVVGAMRRAGVEFLAGTDTPNPYCFPGFSLHDELALLVETGLTPIEALQSATLGPAKYLGKLDSLGTVESGKIADLVLLDANPLEDIRNIQKINTVIIGGRRISSSERQEMLVEVEATTNQRASGWFIDVLVSHMIESAVVIVLLTLFLPLYLYHRQKRRRARSLREP
jgi:adenine deaminase